jgi:hypothetical protein
MSKIHFLGGEKGGVGKSVLARVLAQYYIDKALPFAAVDADRSHGAMLRFYAEYTQAGDLDNFETSDHILQLALDTDRRVLVDLPAQSHRLLTRWMQQGGIAELAAEQHVPLVYWHVLDDGKDALSLLENVLAGFDKTMQFVAVKNYGRGGDFSAFDNSDAKKKLEEQGGKSMTLDELHKPTMRKIDHLNVSFWAAGNNDQAGLGIIERHRTKVWMRNAYKEFERIEA